MSLFENWELLAECGHAFRLLIGLMGFEPPQTPHQTASVLDEIVTRLHARSFPIELRERLAAIQAPPQWLADLFAHEAGAILPLPWRQLYEDLTKNNDIQKQIQSKVRAWASRCFGEKADEVRPGFDELERNVVERLFFVIVRNAEKWAATPNRGDTWWGFVYRHIPKLTQREVNDYFGAKRTAFEKKAGSGRKFETTTKGDAGDSDRPDRPKKPDQPRNFSLRELEDERQLNPAKAAEHKDEVERLNRALERLPQRLLRVVRLRFYEELAWEHVALAIKVTPRTAQADLRRALEMLREYLPRP